MSADIWYEFWCALKQDPASGLLGGIVAGMVLMAIAYGIGSYMGRRDALRATRSIKNRGSR
jgi:hypothetical protein